MSFLDFLLKQGYLSEAQHKEASGFVKDGEGIEASLERAGLNNTQLLLAKGEFYHTPTKHLEPGDLPDRVLKLIPDKSIEFYQMLPLGLSEGNLLIGFVDPSNSAAREAADFIATTHNTNFTPYVVTKFDFDRIRGNLDSLSTEVGDVLTELETELTVDTGSTRAKQEEKEQNVSEDAPVTKIVATILRYATEGNASDIHIEPYEETRVRFRIDGGMIQRLTLPSTTHPALVARIKILSNMKLDEKRKPQDGRFSAHIDGRKIDFRVSSFPTYHGEKIVMRLLDPETNVAKMEDLGLSERNLDLVNDAINEPFGLILISGPTGSGKSTTLYSMLKKVDKDSRNVLSLEDPVEYQMEGVSQSSVRPDIGYTFASGLRTALRQDPDIIMVGEIRDKETAQLAIQAALTGHLVLSTIHTNNAVGVIPRLIDMGVDPYLIAPTLKLVMAQRLIKKLCPNSGKELPIEGSIRRIIDEEFKDLPIEYRRHINVPRYVMSAQPSTGCPSGTRGRVAVFEAMRMTNQIEKILLEENANEVAIHEEARKDGMLSLREDAIIKSFEHIVPFEEVNKLGSGTFG